MFHYFFKRLAHSLYVPACGVSSLFSKLTIVYDILYNFRMFHHFFLTFLKFFTCNSLEMVWSFTKVELLPPHPHPLARFDNFHSLLGTFWRGVIIGAPAGLSSLIITGKPAIQSSMISTVEPSWAVSIKAVGSYGLEKLC